MATVWMSYAWADNAGKDVDFVAQELVNAGVTVKLDRWNIQAGKRLWSQIENFIQDSAECDAWVLYATPNSLGSEACKEEFAYALDRALSTRGQAFPVIGLFPGTVDVSLIPAAVRTRLYVSLNEPDWKERIKAAAEGRTPAISRPTIQPYFIKVYAPQVQVNHYWVIELRPRAGTWSPFFAAVPSDEKDDLKPSILCGPSGRLPQAGMMIGPDEVISTDGLWWMVFAQNEATPTQSYYVSCNKLPSKLLFGVLNGQPQYLVEHL